jgi:uncharacterized protein (TIGR03437 family)
MRLSFCGFVLLACAGILASPALPAEADAVAIAKNIRAKHMPFGVIVDPVYDSITGSTIVGYSRCGDAALWTGAFIAAESFRYKVTQSPDALDNVKFALGGLKSLVDVTGDNRLARCIFSADWQFASYVENEEKSNTIHQAAPWVWVDNTSRDEVVGAFFGLAVAYDFVDDASVKATIGPLASRIAHFISGHQWSPNDDISNTFQTRPEELQMLLQTTRHVNPGDSISGPFFVLPVNTGVLADIQSNDSYFKFNLDYMTFFNLVRYQNNDSNMGAYVDVRNYTASHQNPFFDSIDHALRGSNSFDGEIRPLLDQWLLRPKRDLYVDLSKMVQVCGSEACKPIPILIRPPTDFLWQRDPFMLTGGGYGTTEGAGIDYILPYWMGRYYGMIPSIAVQSAAAVSYNLAPNSIGSMYGANLASTVEQASAQPLPTVLGGASVMVTDAAGVQRPAPLIYVSPTQINFVVPDGTSAGNATFAINNGATALTATAPIQSVAPTLFSADSSGTGTAAATAIQTQANNPKIQSPIQVFQCGDSGCSAAPIQLGVDTPIYVSFYGTGIRNGMNISLSINGVNLPIQYAGPAPGFTGLDQINVPLDLSLRGAGQVNVTLTVDGQTANTVSIWVL